MSDFALIDYKHPRDGYANRDQTGTFGSAMNASGIMGRVVSSLKKNSLILPNLSLAYAKAILREGGYKANYYNGMPQGESYVIIASSMHQYKNEVELAQLIKQKYPESKIGFIGAFSSERPEFFNAVADFIIKGEPELALRKFCAGEIELKGFIDVPSEIDVTTLPFPDWEGVDISTFGYFPALLRKPFLTIQASRGCPFACEFCPYIVMQEAPLRRRSNENIVAEIRELIHRYGIKSLLFRDITFSFNVKATKELCKMIADEKFDLDIACETRLDRLDEELVQLMAHARFKVINLGIESPRTDIVKKSGRPPIANLKMETMVRSLEENGIKVQAFYILGLLDDTEESIRGTIDYSHKLNTFTAQFCVLTPFPGTKTFEKLKDRLITTDFSKFTEYDAVVRIDGVTPERLQELKDLAFNTYYFRLSWFAKHGGKLMLDFLHGMTYQLRKVTKLLPINRPTKLITNHAS